VSPNASCDCTSDRDGILSTQTLSDDNLLIEATNGVLTLTINRPEKRNALRMDMLDALGAALADHAQDETLKVAVITASGDRCFASGGDLKELDAIRSTDQAQDMSKRGRRALDQVRNFPLPVIAALNGLALGGGAELAMACDLRIATANAEIGFLQGQLGVTTAWGGGIDLVAALGNRCALNLLISAQRLTAKEAFEIGLFDRVCVANENLDTCLSAFMQPYLTRSRQVLTGFKALTTGHRQTAHKHLSSIEQKHFVTSWTSAEHWAAVEQATANRHKK
jgi:enoyl-CoA hydratase